MASANEYPLTPLQALFWAGHRFHDGVPLYNMAHTFALRTPIDVLRFQRAFQRVVDRCDVLRTVFAVRDGMPVQRVMERFPYGLAVVDLRSESDAERVAQDWVADRVARSMDIERCCFDSGLLRLADDHHIWFLNQHHIICDATSTTIVFQRMAEAYESNGGGVSSPMPAFCDHVARRLADPKARVEERIAYWQARLGEETETPSFYGKAGTSTPARVVRVGHSLGRERSDRLRALAHRSDYYCRSERVTLFNLFAAVLSVFLLRITGQRRFIIGMPHHGRDSELDRSTAGLYIDVLPLPVTIDPGMTFAGLVAALAREAAESIAHRPFAGLEGVGARTFDVLFNYQVAQFPTFNGLPAEQEWINPGYGAERLVLQVHDFTQSGELSLYLDFDVEVFDDAARERAARHLLTLLDRVLDHPETEIAGLHVLSDDERHHILDGFNPPRVGLPEPAVVPVLFELQSRRTPDAPAVRYGDEQLSYGELDRRTNQLARYLQHRGAGPGVPVGLCIDRSIHLIVGMLGILKAGSAYVPLDVSYPAERLGLMAHDAGFTVLLTQEPHSSLVPVFEGEVICLDRDWYHIADESDMPVSRIIEPDSPAYLMYTSGSTGKPKAVAVPHRAIVRLVVNTNYIQFQPKDRVAQASNASFDAATFEVWGALLNGAELVGIPREVALKPSALAKAISDGDVNVMFLTVALFNQVARLRPDIFRSLRCLIVGGEACDADAVRLVLENGAPRHFLNGYGPTENATFTTYYNFTALRPGEHNVPIGTPIANSYVHILSDDMQPAPVGVPGELYIGGPGLALGYHNRPEMTEASFIANPFLEGEKLYRSGDLARYLEDGVIEFIGRMDGQVKLRGFRIELGEIQAALNAHEGIRDSVVVLREDLPGDKRLVAYIVPDTGDPPQDPELRDFLQRSLPDYMVPTAFVSLNEIPLTPNGKIDRRALPVPDVAVATQGKYIEPQTPLDREIASLWEETLQLPRISMDDRFFDVGGHSLLAVRIMATLHDRYGVDVPLTRFFQDPTVSGMAALIEAQRGGQPPSETDDTPFTLVPIQPHGFLPPLFCVATAGGVLFPYFNLAPLLGPEQPLFGLQDPALEGTRAPFDSVEALAAHYVDVMRGQQPEGPYYLCGWSFGGTVAFEMGRQLRDAGQQVALLVIIDAMQAPPDLSVHGGMGKFLRVWLRRARIFILNTYHLKPYILDGLYLVFRRGWKERGSGTVSIRDYFRWAFTDVIFKHAGVANVVSKDHLLLMKVPAFRRVFKVLHANGEIWKHYISKPFDGIVTVFRAEVQPPELVGKNTLGWGEVAGGGVDVHVLPGYHSEILGKEISHCAEHLRECLSRARTPSDPLASEDRPAAT